MNKPSVRCAIYTRKSTDEGLSQEFNSLDAQREACSAYILSQKAEGWIELLDVYDDGGHSGGSLERPALKRLLRDIEASSIDVVVVYKIDRLSRSLLDFAKLVEVFDRKKVTFVSITQSFNTTTSMGRLTLNVLLSFAQFEREVIGERIRDKVSASKKKGMWMGGNPPLGYDILNRKLVVNPIEADTVRLIYQRYLDLGCVRLLATDMKERRILSKLRKLENGSIRGGGPLNPSSLYRILTNRVYVGETVHRCAHYPGQHDAILSRELFSQVRQRLADLAPRIKVSKRSSQTSLLRDLVFDETGTQMVPSYTIKHGGIRYRYYVSRPAMKGERAKASIYRLPAIPFEALVENVLKRLSLPSGARQREYIQRINIFSHSVAIKFDRHALLSTWRENNKKVADQLIFKEMQQALEGDEQLNHDDHTIVLVLPIRARFRGNSYAALHSDPEQARLDRTILRAVARAHQWRKLLCENQVTSIDALAQRFGLDRGHARLTLNLAFINPVLTRSIIRGAYPNLRIVHLVGARFPLSWREQQQGLSDFKSPRLEFLRNS